jgi:hypothetical protein
MNNLLPFKKLYCENVNQISDDILFYLQNKTRVISKDDKHWRFLNVLELVKNVPSLVNYFKTFDLKLRDVAAVVVTHPSALLPHKDDPSVVTKINFPVLNTKDTYNVWWDDTGKEIGRIEMVQPIAFNASIKHGIEFSPLPVFPRIVLSCMFFNEPTHLLVP